MFVSVRFRAHCHATEDEERVRQAVKFLASVPDKDIKVTINHGYHGNEIRVLECQLAKGPRLTNFLERLVEDGLFDRMEGEVEQRLDDECFFYMRFDKQEAYQGRLVLDTGKDTVHVKAKVQAYPAKPAKAAKEVRAHIEKIRNRLARGR